MIRRGRFIVTFALASMGVAACSTIWGFEDLTAGVVEAPNEAGDGTTGGPDTSENDGGHDAGEDVVQIFDSSRQEAAVCNPLGQTCNGSGTCCTANCVPDAGTTGTCGLPIRACSPPDATCAKNDECCTFSCVSGKCSNQQCVPDKPTPGACTSDFDCCSQNCVDDGTGGGVCAPIPPDQACRTLGSPCTIGSDCCSKQCTNGVCNNASFCQQETDVCSANFQCCGGRCEIAAGQILGRCGPPPAPGGGIPTCAPNGTICSDAGVCSDACCSRLCAPLGATKIEVCHPSGCAPTGNVCRQDNQCCGHSGSPPPVSGPVVCAKVTGTDEFGRCNNGNSCSEPGSLCKGTSTSCNLANNCCEPNDAGGGANCNNSPDGCCKLDAIGSRRCVVDYYDCTANPNPPATKKCVTSADCCGNPCIGTNCVAASCVSNGGVCVTSSDCCFGVACARGPNAPTGRCGGTVLPDGGVSDAGSPNVGCGLLGQTCPDPDGGVCCEGVPCTGGRCRSPSP